METDAHFDYNLINKQEFESLVDMETDAHLSTLINRNKGLNPLLTSKQMLT